MTRIHAIPLTGGRKIIYCLDTIRFFIVQSDLVPLIRRVANGADMGDLEADGIRITSEQFEDLRGKLGGAPACSVGCPPAGHLARFVLNIRMIATCAVATAMRIVGDYGGQRGLMDAKTLERALDYFSSRYQEIAVIQLFGGKPTLNIPAIEQTCRYFRKKKQNPYVFVPNRAFFGLRPIFFPKFGSGRPFGAGD